MGPFRKKNENKNGNDWDRKEKDQKMITLCCWNKENEQKCKGSCEI